MLCRSLFAEIFALLPSGMIQYIGSEHHQSGPTLSGMRSTGTAQPNGTAYTRHQQSRQDVLSGQTFPVHAPSARKQRRMDLYGTVRVVFCSSTAGWVVCCPSWLALLAAKIVCRTHGRSCSLGEVFAGEELSGIYLDISSFFQKAGGTRAWQSIYAATPSRYRPRRCARRCIAPK